MKKIISVLMVAVCLMMAAPAQAQLHFGVKGGLNISKLSFSKDAFKGDNKTGFFVGPMAEFTLPIIGIGADVAALYSQTDLGVDGEKTMKTTLWPDSQLLPHLQFQISPSTDLFPKYA